MPVQTPLRFHTPSDVPWPPGELPAPETVVVEFESRELVWHALGLSEPFETEPAREWAPTLTMVINEGEPIEVAFSLALRFLSALAFHFEVAASVHGFGATGEIDPLHPAGRKEAWGRRNGTTIMPAPWRLEVENNERLRLALAVYREGVSANSKYLGFVALWNVIDAAHDGNPHLVDAFLNAETAGIMNADVNSYIANVLKMPAGGAPPKDIADYFRFHGRDAIAHVVRRETTRTHTNPDDLDDRFRLDADTYFLHALARRAIERHWPHAVTVTPRVDDPARAGE